MNYDKYQYLRIEIGDDGVAILTLDRPDTLNAASVPMHHELERIWLDINDDERIRAVVLTGAGKAFSAGGDLKGMARRVGTKDNFRHSLRAPGNTRRLWQNMVETSPPVIAAINGDAAGFGCSLALFCDITVMAENARIGDSHTKVGLVAGDGGAVVMPLLIGDARAKDLLMRGRLITGREAHAMGLVTHVFPQEQVLAEATAIARELAALPTWAVQWTKLSVNKRVKEQLNLVLDTSIAYEMLTMNSGDHAAAVTAFAEKRKPEFKGE
ncbi:enoyl-CoA hydratase/isomerase family protein [Variovorax sp. PBL-E5]|uniref:enoyl-CoA hydratase/isomerase family protein n=1 Tax=Variovorax sp. PBL-E5 TaxID=434014 RepID=UPI001317D777|nr:enoyl-CoA hydratase-related protein [Variovorax sp. PBL-E5]VTU46098.1 putative enoyl-CoA hydratase echA8 [Variovorax sp. PBL-E5]